MYKLLKMELGKQNNCPFPHGQDKFGNPKYEKNASSGLSKEGQFNCFVCGKSFTDEVWFTSSYLNVSHKDAQKWLDGLNNSRTFIPTLRKWKENQEKLQEELKDPENKHYIYLKSLGLLDIVEEARLGLYLDNITFPYIYKGIILNLTQFCVGQIPKYKTTRGAVSGIMGTTKLFDPKKDEIIIAAGEKDMLVLTAFGFNAVTLMGGEKIKPTYYKNVFKDKKIYIAYDNDKAGMEGALDLAKWLYRYTRTIKVLNIGDVFNELDGDLTAVATEDKEDVTDYFIKYNRNEIDFENIMDNANWFQPPALEDQTLMEMVSSVNKTMKQIREVIAKNNSPLEQNKRKTKKDEDNSV